MKVKVNFGLLLVIFSISVVCSSLEDEASSSPAKSTKCTSTTHGEEDLVPIIPSAPCSTSRNQEDQLPEQPVSIPPESALETTTPAEVEFSTETTKMSLTKACCSTPSIESDYEAKGSDFQLENLTIYETGDLTSNRVLIAVYDIFGFSPQVKQVADKIGGTGFRVAVPGFFYDGSPWNSTNFPPADLKDLFTWIAKEGSWDKIKVDVLAVIEHYKKQGVTSFGIFGFCWGGKMAIQAGTELPEIKGAGLVHPSSLTQEDFEKVQSPVLILPSKDEVDMIPFYNIAKERLGENAVEHVRFDDMHHGFVGARGDFKDELNRKRVDEVLLLLVNFFKKHL